MNMKKLTILPLMIVALVLTIVAASAIDVSIENVELDDVDLDASVSNSILSVDKNQELDLRVQVENTGTETLEDVQIEARIRGYDQRDLIGDITRAFDMKPGVTYTKDLSLIFPVRMDQQTYKLRISVVDADSSEVSETYELEIEAESHAMWIRDLILNPESTVQSGRALLATVRVKNIGNEDEDGLKIKVSVPELGISATDFVSEVEEDEAVTSEELYMRIPTCTKAGVYDVYAEVVYHDGDEKEVKQTTIEVVESGACPGDTPAQPEETEAEVSMSIDVQNVVAGEAGVIYPVVIENPTAQSKTFTVSVDADEWADVRVSPTNVFVVKAGQSQTAYVFVSAKEDAQPGQNLIGVTVKDGSKVIEQFTATANVVAGEEDGLNDVKRYIEIGLIVLVILLVILAIIVAVSRMKKDKDDEGDEAQTYY